MGEETMENKEDNNVEEEKSAETNNEPTKDRINDKIDSKENAEVEKAVDEKADRLVNYLKGFVKRVIFCTILVIAGKNSWPYLQSRFWPEAPTKEGKLYILNDRSFRGHVSRGDHFVMMFAPWCGHCARLKPDWEKLAKNSGVKETKIGKVDCTANKDVCKKYDVTGYP